MEEVKRIPTVLEIKDFIITFEYIAWRSNKRKTDKRSIKHFDKDEAKKVFKEWSSNIRTMSNAKILDIKEIQENSQVIEL